MPHAFQLTFVSQDSEARLGLFTTPHGSFETPTFMPVGTQGTVKALIPEDLYEADVKIILGNTYHLYLRPGHKIISKLGGLHRFMNWKRAILTDSGGFQIYSLSKLREVNDDGVVFQSHIDGSKHLFTPELSMEVQAELGSDIMMVLDDVPGFPCPRERARVSVNRTISWAERCLKCKNNKEQALFAIVQGGIFPDLRELCAKGLVEMGFDGYAIGGLAVGEDMRTRMRVLDETIRFLPKGAPRYLMGVGTPQEILMAVEMGVDMFDCVIPTRNARNGALYTSLGRINIRNSQYSNDKSPCDDRCNCYTCKNYSKAYLRHLYIAKELLAYRLGTIHNIWFFSNLMARIREGILTGTMPQVKEEYSKYKIEED